MLYAVNLTNYLVKTISSEYEIGKASSTRTVLFVGFPTLPLLLEPSSLRIFVSLVILVLVRASASIIRIVYSRVIL